MPRLRKPRALAHGATLGVAAPGMPVDPEKLTEGASLWREAGFEVVYRDDVLARTGYLAGDDARRAGELMDLIGDPGIDAIVFARAGYGCDRILSRLDPAKVRAAAKPLIGYSDITALLLWQRRRAGLVGFHGPMLDRGRDVEPAAFASLVAQLRGEAALPLVLSGRGAVGGEASGRLVGGSLTLLAASVGTPWEVDARGAILLLEDIGERPYRIDRMLQQLASAGILARAAGIGIGAFQCCVDEKYPQPAVAEVLEEALRPLGVPVVTDLPFGHVRDNHPWPVGCRATLDGRSGELRIEERGVRSR